MDSISTWIGLAVGIAAIAISAVVFIMRYLQHGFMERTITRKELEVLRHELMQTQKYNLHEPKVSEEWIQSVRDEISQLKDSVAHIGDDEREKIIGELKQKLESETTDSILSDIQQKANQLQELKEKDEVVDSNFEKTISRLREELYSLGKRSNLNLALGVVTTITGLSILGVFVLSKTTEMKEVIDFIKHFVPRISLVIFIEIFAYFFLRLYKDTLSETKYFQNEITNIEAKYLAARMALYSNSDENITCVINELSKTERNHILNKGQTTVDIEKSKIDHQFSSTLIEKITSILQKKS